MDMNPFLHSKGLERTLTTLRHFYHHMPGEKNNWIFAQMYDFMLALVLKKSNVSVLSSFRKQAFQ
jgi:hypothetical protein